MNTTASQTTPGTERHGDPYIDYLTTKITTVEQAGIDVDPTRLHPSTRPHQRDAILWALGLGRAGIFMDFGLGKTHIQIEIARRLVAETGKPFLIVCPLGAKHQFQAKDAPRLGVDIRYVKEDAEIDEAQTPYLITNYARIREGNIDPRRHDFAGVSLDEASALRHLDSKTYQTFNEVLSGIPYRFVATATPSPNNYLEILNYAEFLDVMDRGQALTRFFQRNPDKAGDLTLMPHMEREFWLWVASWALFVTKPSDLGYSDEGYKLPDLNVHWHRLPVDHTRAWEQTDNRGQHRLILDAANGVTEAAKENRETMDARISKMREIVNEHPDRHWLLWHHLEDERRMIEKMMPAATSVYGSQDLETREERIIAFSNGEIPILATKPQIAGSGCNFQDYCHSAIYAGPNYKFNDFYQSIHRLQRAGQDQPVDIHIIYTESQESVVDTLKRKWRQHEEMREKMRAIVKEYGLSHEAIRQDLQRRIGVERREVKGERFRAVRNDCVLESRRLDDNSIGLVWTSIPFSDHYEYSVQYEDFGHNHGDDPFFAQMDFLIPELYRALKPGRIAAVHVKDRILYGHQTDHGFMEINPFSDKVIRAFCKHGFILTARRTVVTDVVRENASTYRLGWTEMAKDASKMGAGLPEYILTFRKPPSGNDTQYADDPIVKDKNDYTRGRWQIDAHSLWRSNGNRLMSHQELAHLPPADVARYYENEQLNGDGPYDHERHVAICETLDERGHLPASWMLLPPKVTQSDEDHVWNDVRFMDTLNVKQSRKRKQNHVCPLPLDMTERIIRLYSNEGDVVLDPFAGLFTVPYKAIEMGRQGLGFELNDDYFQAGVSYCQDIERDVLAPTLFDFAASQTTLDTEQHGGIDENEPALSTNGTSKGTNHE